jgi:hypothetical protein
MMILASENAARKEQGPPVIAPALQMPFGALSAISSVVSTIKVTVSPLPASTGKMGNIIANTIKQCKNVLIKLLVFIRPPIWIKEKSKDKCALFR